MTSIACHGPAHIMKPHLVAFHGPALSLVICDLAQGGRGVPPLIVLGLDSEISLALSSAGWHALPGDIGTPKVESHSLAETGQAPFRFTCRSQEDALLRAEALRLLAPFAAITDQAQAARVRDAIDTIVVEVFPQDSWELQRGSPQGVGYRAQLTALLDSLVTAAEEGSDVVPFLQVGLCQSQITPSIATEQTQRMAVIDLDRIRLYLDCRCWQEICYREYSAMVRAKNESH